MKKQEPDRYFQGNTGRVPRVIGYLVRLLVLLFSLFDGEAWRAQALIPGFTLFLPSARPCPDSSTRFIKYFARFIEMRLPLGSPSNRDATQIYKIIIAMINPVIPRNPKHPVERPMEAKALRSLLPTMKRCALIAGAFIVLGSSSSHAASATWISSSGNWSESAKWNGALPHGYSDIATFSNYGNGTINLAGQAVKGIIFTTDASAYHLTGSTNYLEIEGAGFIQTQGTGANSQVISQAIAMRGAALSITNDYTDSSKTLTIAGPLYSRHNATSTLTLNGGNTGANTISGPISNNNGAAAVVAIAKSGSGNWILSGTNTYTGTTTISEGALMVTGTHSGGGAYTIGNGGTLGGAGGKIGASGITLGVGGGLNISGAGLGTVGAQNGLVAAGTLELASSLNISQAGADSLSFVLATPGTSDHVKLSSGTLNIGNGVLSLDTFKFDISNWAVTGAEGTYTLFTAASSSGISGYLASSGLTGILGAYGVELFLGTTESGMAALKLDVTAIPEPATIHIVGLGLLAGWVAARRRRKS